LVILVVVWFDGHRGHISVDGGLMLSVRVRAH
jgi:hypothetical protein